MCKNNIYQFTGVSTLSIYAFFQGIGVQSVNWVVYNGTVLVAAAYSGDIRGENQGSAQSIEIIDFTPSTGTLLPLSSIPAIACNCVRWFIDLQGRTLLAVSVLTIAPPMIGLNHHPGEIIIYELTGTNTFTIITRIESSGNCSLAWENFDGKDFLAVGVFGGTSYSDEEAFNLSTRRRRVDSCCKN